MRIISQGDEHDIPYEISTLWRDANIIWAAVSQVGNIIVAQYSTQEKAEKAMQKLHECYTGIFILDKIPSPDDIKKDFAHMDGFFRVSSCSDNISKVSIDNSVFRFPNEDEL